MIEPGVEFAQHPGGARACHQPERAGDLVGEVELTAASLGLGERRQNRLPDGEQRLAALDGQGSEPAVTQYGQSVLLATEVGFKVEECSLRTALVVM